MKYIDDIDLVNLKFSNGMIMLPFYRYTIMTRINNGLSIPPKVFNDSVIKKIFRIFSNLRKCKVKKAKFLFFSSTLFNVKNRDGKYFNSLDGFYYDLFPDDSLLIEDADGSYFWRTTSSYKNLSFINTYLVSLSSILAKLIHSLHFFRRNPDLISFSKSKYNPGLSVVELELDDIRISVYSRLIQWLLKKTNCEIIFVNCACYGGYNSIIINKAKELGIRSVELQHGCIDEGNYAYNEDKLASCEVYYSYLPDEIWTFGTYWNRFIRWKVDKYIVGNAYLNTFKDNYIGIPITNDFLIISQPIYDVIVSFVTDLALLYPDKSITVRLHPRDDINEYNQLRKYPNVLFSNSEVNLYEDIAKSDSIIGLFSTCLYESLAFEKKLYIIDCEWSRESFPYSIGTWVKSAKDIVTGNSKTIDYSTLWQTGFEKNVKKALLSNRI